MLIETILAALLPVGIEGVKQVINKFTGSVTPQTVDDQIKLMEAETARLKAVGELDNPYGTPSQWVIDLRASSRYIAALAVILGGMVTFYIPKLSSDAYTLAAEAISIVFGFLFGTRILAGIKR